MTPIKPGTAARLGITRPQPRPEPRVITTAEVFKGLTVGMVEVNRQFLAAAMSMGFRAVD